MSSSLRTPRGRRGTTAAIVALVGLLASAFGAIEAGYAIAHDSPWLVTRGAVPDYLHRTTLGDTVVLVVAIVLIVVGALLLLAALLPPRRRLVELAASDPDLATGMSRRSVRRTLSAAATRVDGISETKIDLGRRRVKVRATTMLRNTDGLGDRVRTAVSARLDALTPRTARTVRVRLDSKGD